MAIAVSDNAVMDLALSGKAFAVAGGSRGLGFATAAVLVAEGASVVLGAAHEETGRAAVERLGGSAQSGVRASYVVLDSADPNSADGLIRAVKDRHGRFDGVLISGAGTPSGGMLGTSDDTWAASFDALFLGGLRIARTAASALAGEVRGRESTEAGSAADSILFVLGSSVRVSLPRLAVSNGLYPGLAGVVKMLADELGPSGIRVNGILPVRIDTDRVRALDGEVGDPQAVRSDQSQKIPLRRYGEPEEFGRIAAFLLSPAASYVAGALIPVDGGAIRAI
jgi:3-oxoacyl-[acyl-carrier protein] reductase